MNGALLVSAGYALVFASVPVLVAWHRSRSVVLDVLADVLLIAGNLLAGTGILMQGSVYGTVNIAAAAWVAWSMWRRWKRRRRDRAPRSLGDESRLLIAALVAKLRESAQPRLVLRPGLGGAS